MSYLSLLLFLGCPVDPKEIQDQQNQSGFPPSPRPIVNGDSHQGRDKGTGQHVPPAKGSPSQTKIGEEPVAIPPQPSELGAPLDPLTDGAASQQPNSGEEVVPIPPDPSELREPPVGDLSQNNEKPTPLPDAPPEQFHQPGEIPTPGEEQPIPNKPPAGKANAGDIMTRYQRLPSFSNLIEDDSISIKLEVSDVEQFDFEFVVLRQNEKRSFPKVVHKEVSVTSPVQIKAPANFNELVWVIISVDQENDGVTDDDLYGGSTEGLQLLESDMSLSYQVSNNRSFLNSLPWYSQASEGPQQPL